MLWSQHYGCLLHVSPLWGAWLVDMPICVWWCYKNPLIVWAAFWGLASNVKTWWIYSGFGMTQFLYCWTDKITVKFFTQCEVKPMFDYFFLRICFSFHWCSVREQSIFLPQRQFISLCWLILVFLFICFSLYRTNMFLVFHMHAVLFVPFLTLSLSTCSPAVQ